MIGARIIAILVIVLAIACGVTPVSAPVLGYSPVPPDVGGAGECSCDVARQQHRWCSHCQVGYIAGVAIPSRMLYEAIDAHGHEIDATRLRCEQCQGAIKKDALCSQCNFGFNNKLLYFSRLTWAVSKGEVIVAEPSITEPSITEPSITEENASDPHNEEESNKPTSQPRSAADPQESDPVPPSAPHDHTPHHFCEACQQGVVGEGVGRVRIRQKEIFEVADFELYRLRKAIALLEECEICGVVQFTGARCPQCDIRYNCTCETAREENGWCRHCQVGHFAAVRWTDPNQHSELVALFGRGDTEAQQKVPCPSAECKALLTRTRSTPGWCEECGRGSFQGRRFDLEQDIIELRRALEQNRRWPPRADGGVEKKP